MAKKTVSRESYVEGKVLAGLEGLRTRLSMYLGSTGILREGHAPRALTQMLQETVSNSADEFLAGFGDEINVTINRDGSATVLDHGRGIPKGPGRDFSNVVDMFTKAHASGKFDDSSYASAGTAGMNGIGMKAVNAGSKKLEVEACSLRTKKQNGKTVPAGGNEHYRIVFQQDTVVKKEIIHANTNAPTFTKVTFFPDDGPISATNPDRVLSSTEWVVGDIVPRLESTAFLMDGLRITLSDEREGHEFSQTWLYEHGIEDYLDQRLEGSETIRALSKKPIVIRQNTVLDENEFELRAAFTWTEDFGSDIVSYANGVPTPEGGPHLDGFRQALAASFRDFGENRKFTRKRLEENDVLDGLVAVFEIKIPSRLADFEGQTKEKLGTVEAKKAVAQIIDEFMPKWMFDNETSAKALVEKMKDSQASHEAALKARREAKASRTGTNGTGKLIISPKLKTCSSKKPEECELYIVEGDSASKIGRDPKTQAVFQLRGKILNAYRKSITDSLSNKEISTIAAAIGANIGREFDIEKMRYHKIIIACDKDSDGGHIEMLLLGIFYKLFPGLIESGRLYVGQPPLYRAVKYIKGEPNTVLLYSDEEFAKRRRELEGYQISRYKGLGEMETPQLHEALTNPKTRKLARVTMPDHQEAARMLKIILGSNAELRKEWISANVDFAIDNDIER